MKDHWPGTARPTDGIPGLGFLSRCVLVISLVSRAGDLGDEPSSSEGQDKGNVVMAWTASSLQQVWIAPQASGFLVLKSLPRKLHLIHTYTQFSYAIWINTITEYRKVMHPCKSLLRNTKSKPLKHCKRITRGCYSQKMFLRARALFFCHSRHLLLSASITFSQTAKNTNSYLKNKGSKITLSDEQSIFSVFSGTNSVFKHLLTFAPGRRCLHSGTYIPADTRQPALNWWLCATLQN